MVYHIELHVAVNEHPERFLKTRVFYFTRSTKGEMTVQYHYNKARSRLC